MSLSDPFPEAPKKEVFSPQENLRRRCEVVWDA